MKMLKSNTGILSTKSLTTAITSIVLLVVVLYLYASLVPTTQAAGASMNNTARCSAAGGTYCGNMTTPYCYNACTPAGTVVTYSQIPLSTIFSSQGVMMIIIMAALVIAIVLAFLPGKKK